MRKAAEECRLIAKFMKFDDYKFSTSYTSMRNALIKIMFEALNSAYCIS